MELRLESGLICKIGNGTAVRSDDPVSNFAKIPAAETAIGP